MCIQHGSTLKSHQICAQKLDKKVSPFYLYQTLCPVTVIVWLNFVDLGQIITEKVVSRLKVFVHATHGHFYRAVHSRSIRAVATISSSIGSEQVTESSNPNTQTKRLEAKV